MSRRILALLGLVGAVLAMMHVAMAAQAHDDALVVFYLALAVVCGAIAVWEID